MKSQAKISFIYNCLLWLGIACSIACSTACSTASLPVLLPEIQFDLRELNSRFTIRLPEVDANDPCAAIAGAAKACLILHNAQNDTVILSGTLTHPATSPACAAVTLSGTVENTFSESSLERAEFTMLNQTTASCLQPNPVADGGEALGKSLQIQRQSQNNGSQHFTLQWLQGNQANLITTAQSRAFHTATRLYDGRVLITGGIDATGEVLNSALLVAADGGEQTALPVMACGRYQHNATLIDLPESPLYGKVLLSGGIGDGRCTASQLAAFEIFDPATLSFAPLLNSNTQLPMTLEQSRFAHSVLRVHGKSLFITGGFATDGSLIAADQTNYVLDLINLNLMLSNTQAPAPATGLAFASHGVMPVQASGIHEIAVQWGGIGNEQWNEASYFQFAIAYLGENFRGYYNFSALMPANERRLRAAVLPISSNVWAIVGGDYLLKPNSLDEIHLLRANLLSWQIGNSTDVIENLALQMAVPRYQFTTATLPSQNDDYLHLLLGGVEAASATSMQSSDAIELLASFQQLAKKCMTPITRQDSATHNFENLHLQKSRAGHTLTQLNNGDFLVWGGFHGNVATDYRQLMFQSPQQILASYELLSQIKIPDRCP